MLKVTRRVDQAQMIEKMRMKDERVPGLYNAIPVGSNQRPSVASQCVNAPKEISHLAFGIDASIAHCEVVERMLLRNRLLTIIGFVITSALLVLILLAVIKR